jgi:hypothetical protein
MAGGKNRQFLGSLLEKKKFLVPMGSIKGMAIFGYFAHFSCSLKKCIEKLIYIKE